MKFKSCRWFRDIVLELNFDNGSHILAESYSHREGFDLTII